VVSQMSQYAFLVFDMDGVIADTSPCHSRAYQDLWRAIGIEGPEYEIIAGRKTADVVAEVTDKLKPSAEQIAQWVRLKQQQARKYLLTETIAFSDTIPCLAAIARSRIPMALGTTASRDTTDLVLNRTGLADVFCAIATGEDVRNGKPAPEIYLHLMLRAGMKPNQTLIIEDSSSGLKSGIASEAYVASVRTGKKVDDPRFIGSFSDLSELLKEIGIQV